MRGPRQESPVKLLALAAGVIVLAAACGTTAPRPQGSASSNESASFGANELENLDTVPPGSVSGDSTAASPTARGSGSVNRGPGATPTGAVGGDPGVGMAPTGRGWDETNVYIGVMTARDTGQVASAMGVAVDPGDPVHQSNAMAKYFNERGGLFGRKVVMRIDDHSFAAVLAQPEIEAQAACTKFTEDESVVAVINTKGEMDTPNLRRCFSKANLPMFAQGTYPFDDRTVHESPGYFAMSVPSWNKFAPVFVERLAGQRYFGGWDTARGAPGATPTRVGIYISDDPVSSRVFDLLKSALTKAGHAPASVYRYAELSDANSAVLQMQSDRVTHIIGLDVTLFAFATAAESQRYRPRYGIHTANAPTAMAANVPAAQQVGAVGVGVAPRRDTARSETVPPGAKLCEQIMIENGQNAEAPAAFGICDAVRILAQAASSGGGLSVQAILRGVAKIGANFPPAATFASGLTSDYPVLSAAGLDLQYRQDCSCYQYANGVLRRF